MDALSTRLLAVQARRPENTVRQALRCCWLGHRRGAREQRRRMGEPCPAFFSVHRSDGGGSGSAAGAGSRRNSTTAAGARLLARKQPQVQGTPTDSSAATALLVAAATAPGTNFYSSAAGGSGGLMGRGSRSQRSLDAIAARLSRMLPGFEPLGLEAVGGDAAAPARGSAASDGVAADTPR